MSTATSSAAPTVTLRFQDGEERGKEVVLPRTLRNGRYEIKEILFYGGMGFILRAIDHRVFGNEVLIKSIKYQASEFAYDKQKALYNIYQLRQMFRRERRILAELRTRGINNIPHINDFFYDENHEFTTKTYPFGKLAEKERHQFLKIDVEVHREPYLVMERILGRSIGERMDALPEKARLRVVRDALVALEKMHRPRQRPDGSTLEMVYLDLKPQNILVDDSGRVTLIDFGGTMPIVNGRKRKEQKGALTYGYAAPECETLFTSIDRVDRRTDLYSAGAMLWGMYTGKNPARLADPISNRYPVLSVDELPSDVAPEIKDLIARALERDPEKRWRHAGEMVEILDRTLGK